MGKCKGHVVHRTKEERDFRAGWAGWGRGALLASPHLASTVGERLVIAWGGINNEGARLPQTRLSHFVSAGAAKA